MWDFPITSSDRLVAATLPNDVCKPALAQTSTTSMDLIERRFAEAFAAWGLCLPAQAARARERGEIEARGWRIRYLFGRDTAGEYVDYYATHRMADDAHVRIRESGEVEHLPSISSGYFTSDDPAEAQRLEEEYLAQNRRIAAELRAKGF